MEVTEVKISLRHNENNRKLKAYVTVTIDQCFVVREMKIIEGTKGLFVAMPAVKTKVACPRCHHRNVIRSNYCNQCGAGIPPLPEPVEPVEDKRVSEYTDIAHPITGECREHIQDRVLREYRRAAEQAAAVSEAECSRAVA